MRRQRRRPSTTAHHQWSGFSSRRELIEHRRQELADYGRLVPPRQKPRRAASAVQQHVDPSRYTNTRSRLYAQRSKQQRENAERFLDEHITMPTYSGDEDTTDANRQWNDTVYMQPPDVDRWEGYSDRRLLRRPAPVSPRISSSPAPDLDEYRRTHGHVYHPKKTKFHMDQFNHKGFDCFRHTKLSTPRSIGVDRGNAYDIHYKILPMFSSFSPDGVFHEPPYVRTNEKRVNPLVDKAAMLRWVQQRRQQQKQQHRR